MSLGTQDVNDKMFAGEPTLTEKEKRAKAREAQRAKDAGDIFGKMAGKKKAEPSPEPEKKPEKAKPKDKAVDKPKQAKKPAKPKAPEPEEDPAAISPEWMIEKSSLELPVWMWEALKQLARDEKRAYKLAHPEVTSGAPRFSMKSMMETILADEPIKRGYGPKSKR